MHGRPRTIRRALVSIGLAVLVLSGCSGDELAAEPPPTSSVGEDGAVAVPQPSTYSTLDPTAAPPVIDPGSEPTPEARAVVDATAATLGLQPVEAMCLTHRVDLDPELRDEIDTAQPTSSPRWQQLTDLAAECVRTTTGATNFANGIQAQAGGALSDEQLNCLRDAYAALPAADTRAFVEGALDPDSADPAKGEAFLGLFTGCGIDPAGLPQ